MVDCFCVFACDLIPYILLDVLQPDLVVKAIAILLCGLQSLLLILPQGRQKLLLLLLLHLSILNQSNATCFAAVVLSDSASLL